MDADRIRKKIAEFASSPKNVRFDELAALLDNHIGGPNGLFPEGYNHHGGSHHAFTVGGRTFKIAEPKTGCVKQIYVKHFLNAMEELGLYER